MPLLRNRNNNNSCLRINVYNGPRFQRSSRAKGDNDKKVGESLKVKTPRKSWDMLREVAMFAPFIIRSWRGEVERIKIICPKCCFNFLFHQLNLTCKLNNTWVSSLQTYMLILNWHVKILLIRALKITCKFLTNTFYNTKMYLFFVSPDFKCVSFGVVRHRWLSNKFFQVTHEWRLVLLLYG